MPTTLSEYVIIIVGLFYLTERIGTRVQHAVNRHRKKSLKKYHAELHKISSSANLRAELLWDKEAEQLAKAHVLKRQHDGTLPEPLLPFMDASELYARQIKDCFMGYVHARIMQPHIDKYMEMAKSIIGESDAKNLTEEFMESTDHARETLRDVGFDLEQLDKKLVAA